jgi:pyridoxine/pyridoxamine 5'-phosphate oxidase
MDPAEGTIDTQFSSPDAVATPWSAARDELESAKTYWVTTVRPDGRPHSTTIAAVWLDGAIHFTTGASEVKARNLASNRTVIVAAGCSHWEGLDVVIEGEAVSVTDPDRLMRLATAYTEKYDDFFGMRVADGRLRGSGTDQGPLAFEVRPNKAFAFGKAPTFSQTRWLWS